MNYPKKYLKYKTKYLILKNRNNQIGGNKLVKTLSYNSVINGNSLNLSLTNQCFWIPILQFLLKNNYKINLKNLINEADIDPNTDNIMFTLVDDNGNINSTFLDAVDKIANKYKLNIQIYTGISWHENKLLIKDEPSYSFPFRQTFSPREIFGVVKLVNMYYVHFELIDDIGNDYTPAVIYNGKITKINKIPHKEQEKYKNLASNDELNKLYSNLVDIEIKYIYDMNHIEKDVNNRDIKLKNCWDIFVKKKKDINENINSIKNTILEKADIVNYTPVYNYVYQLLPYPYESGKEIIVNGRITLNSNKPFTQDFNESQSNFVYVNNKRGKVYTSWINNSSYNYYILFDDGKYGLEINESIIKTIEQERIEQYELSVQQHQKELESNNQQCIEEEKKLKPQPQQVIKQSVQQHQKELGSNNQQCIEEEKKLKPQPQQVIKQSQEEKIKKIKELFNKQHTHLKIGKMIS